MSKKLEGSGLIVESYRGYEIPQYPIMKFRASVNEAKKIIDAKLDFGMSIREAIESKKILCAPCNGTAIMKYTPNPQ